MAWLELHQTLWTHRKTLQMAAVLNIPPIYAAAHMAHLWCWALDNAENGDLSGLDPSVIAVAAGWTGEPDTFVQAALAVGYFEKADDGGITIHDWHDYAGRLMDDRAAERERSRRRREEAKKKKTSGRPVVDQRSTGDTVPYRTVHNQDLRSSAATTIDPTVPAAVEAAAAAEGETSKPNEAAARHAALNRIEGVFAQFTGRLIPSPKDMEDMREALRLCRGDAEFVVKAMGAVSNAYKPRFQGDKIRTFSYFLPAIQEAAALRNARAAPMKPYTSGETSEQPSMTAEEQARLAAMTDEILSALPPELLEVMDQAEEGGERHERDDPNGHSPAKRTT